MKLNSDLKVVVERIGNLKEYIKETNQQNLKAHEKMFDRLNSHSKSIATLKAILSGGAFIILLAMIVKMLSR